MKGYAEVIGKSPGALFSAGEHRQRCPRADTCHVSQPLLTVTLHRILRFAILGYI